MMYRPDQLPQSVIAVGPVERVIKEGIGVNVFLGRDRYYPPTAHQAAWHRIEALLDEAQPGFMRIGYLEGTGVHGDVTPWDDKAQAFDLQHDVWKKIAWFDAWCDRHNVHWMLDPWWIPASLQVPYSGHAPLQPDSSGKAPWRGAPRDPGEYADHYIRPLLRHVRDTLHVRRLRWLGLLNEPIWGAQARDPDNFFVREGEQQVRVLVEMYKEVHRVLQAEKMDISLVGPGHLCAWQMPPLDFLAAGVDPSRHLGAWDAHAYFHQPDWMPECTPDFVRTHEYIQHTIRRWVDFARQQDKPFFITEMGTFYFGRPFWGDRDYETAGSHSAAIHDAQFIVRAINEGVDGLLRWVLCADRTVDGRWGLIERHESDAIEPSPHIYPAYRALMRAIPPRASMHAIHHAVADGAPVRVHAVAAQAQGTARMVLVHDRPGRNADVRIECPPAWAGKTFRRCVVDEMRKGMAMSDVVIPNIAKPTVDLMITPYSITTLEERNA